MRPFRHLEGIAAAMPVANIDTDMIVPAQFLKTVSRDGLRRGLFYRQRYDADGAERAGFVLNRAPWREAQLLVTRENFGCGSSREHAPWALLDFGISCIIAPSFAEIFSQNCLKNGMLLIRLAPGDVEALIADAELPARARMIVDLERCTITRADGSMLSFEIDALNRARLLAGIDDVSLSLRRSADIGRHEEKISGDRPWVRAITLP
jgi:3-isopropylmalate/(R)-2-methylmalate dehydratase small subunit